MPNKLNVKTGDTVVVISGKSKGKKGKVLSVFPAKNRVVVEGVNMATIHAKPSQQNPQGGIIHREAPIHVSNVMFYCKKCDKPVRLGNQILEDGSKVRICVKCKEVVD